MNHIFPPPPIKSNRVTWENTAEDEYIHENTAEATLIIRTVRFLWQRFKIKSPITFIHYQNLIEIKLTPVTPDSVIIGDVKIRFDWSLRGNNWFKLLEHFLEVYILY